MGNRYWKDIKRGEKVVETKTCWKVGADTIFWDSKTALKAQRYLHQRALRDKRKK